jgi:hypothetical protein
MGSLVPKVPDPSAEMRRRRRSVSVASPNRRARSTPQFGQFDDPYFNGIADAYTKFQTAAVGRAVGEGAARAAVPLREHR